MILSFNFYIKFQRILSICRRCARNILLPSQHAVMILIQRTKCFPILRTQPLFNKPGFWYTVGSNVFRKKSDQRTRLRHRNLQIISCRCGALCISRPRIDMIIYIRLGSNGDNIPRIYPLIRGIHRTVFARAGIQPVLGFPIPGQNKAIGNAKGHTGGGPIGSS